MRQDPTAAGGVRLCLRACLLWRAASEPGCRFCAGALSAGEPPIGGIPARGRRGRTDSGLPPADIPDPDSGESWRITADAGVGLVLGFDQQDKGIPIGKIFQQPAGAGCEIRAGGMECVETVFVFQQGIKEQAGKIMFPEQGVLLIRRQQLREDRRRNLAL